MNPSETALTVGLIGLGLALLVVVVALVVKAQARSQELRSAALWVGGFALVAVWLSPFGQLPLGYVAQHALLDEVLEYRERPVAELVERFGPFEASRREYSTKYVARPWYAPAGGWFRVELAIQDERLFLAYVDD